MNEIMRHFEYKHLPQPMRGTSLLCATLADMMNSLLPDNAEKAAGIRKLLEAKDCFVRAQLDD